MTTVDDAVRAIAALDDDSVVIHFDPDAVDRTTRSGRLAGEAIVVKNCVAVPGHPTSAGTPALADHHMPVGGAITRLLDEGAVVVATASMHELAFGITGRNGWRGTASNPAAPDRLPGGSSSGSAVAVARGLVDVGIGTDTGGSCRIPAACCGIVGFRPSTGRYPGDGLLNLSPTRDTIGLLAASLDHVTRFDAVLANEGFDDETGADHPPQPIRRLATVDASILAGCAPEVAAAYRAWTASCADQGIELVEVDLAPLLAMDQEAGFAIAHRESVLQFQELCAARGVDYEDFVAGLLNEDVRALMAMAPPPEAARLDALNRVLPVMQQWYADTMAEADLLALPTVPALPPRPEEHEFMALNGESVPTFQTMITFASPASLAGVPSLSVPIPCEAGPVGVMLEADRGQDRRLLASAAQLFD